MKLIPTFLILIALFQLFSSCKEKNEIEETQIHHDSINSFGGALWSIYKPGIDEQDQCYFPSTYSYRAFEFEGEIFASTSHHISKLNNECWESIELGYDNVFGTINSELYMCPRHAETGKKIFKYTNGYWQLAPLFNDSICMYYTSNNGVTDFIQFENSVFFAFQGTDPSVIEYRDHKFQWRHDLKKYTSRFKIDNEDRLWFLSWQTNMGDTSTITEYLYYIKNENLDSILLPNSLQKNDINAINDNNGIIVGTEDNGVFKLTESGWIDISNEYPSERIVDITFDKNGEMWLTTFDIGIAHLTQNGWEIFDETTPLNEYFINPGKMFIDSKNNIWISTWYNGLVKYKGVAFD